MEGIEPARRAPFAKSPAVGAGGARTQRRILEAGLDVFATEGFHAASVESITERAGCSRASFYQYFASKDELFQLMARQVGAGMIEITDRLGSIGADAEGREALHRWLGEYVDYTMAYQPVVATYSATAQSNRSTARGAGSIARRISGVLASRFESSTWDDPMLLARVVGTYVSRAPMLFDLWAPSVSGSRLIDGLADLVHRSIHGPVDGVNMNATPDLPAVVPAVGRTPAATDDEPEMRTRLLAAGRTVFPMVGLHGARVDDIVAEAGVAHGTFYRYFDDKAELFEELALLAAAEAARLLDAFPTDGRTSARRAWVREWLDAYEPHLSILAVWMGAAATEPAVRALGEGVGSNVFASLAALFGNRGFGDPAVDAVAFIAMCERVTVNVVALGTLEREPTVDVVAEVIDRGFLGRVPA